MWRGWHGWNDDQKQKLQGLFAAGMLIGAPIWMTACTGNPLNGEKISLWSSKDPAPAAATPAAGTATKQTPPKPSGPTGDTPATPCNPNTAGTLDATDSELVAFNKEVSDSEAKSPGKKEIVEELKKVLKDANIELQAPELKSLAQQILTASTQSQQPPQPAATPVLEATPAPAPYPLHASLVALNAYSHAIKYAQSALSLTKPDEIKDFAFKLVIGNGAGQPDLAFLAYKKSFELAGKQLSYDATKSKQFVDALINKTKGVQIALAWVGTFNSDINDYGYGPAAAIEDANKGLGYLITPTDPAAGFCTQPAVPPKAQPAATPQPPSPNTSSGGVKPMRR